MQIKMHLLKHNLLRIFLLLYYTSKDVFPCAIRLFIYFKYILDFKAYNMLFKCD